MATTVKVVTTGRPDILSKILGLVWQKWTDDITRAAVWSGTGSPVAAVIADCGTIYVDTAGLAGAVIFIKEDPVNDGTVVGWRAL